MKKSDKEKNILAGQVASGGIAIGKAMLIDQKHVRIPKYWIHDGQVETEIVRFKRAIFMARREIESLKKKLCRIEGQEQISILESHLMMVSDQSIIQETIDRIRQDKINAEWAYEQAISQIEKVFSQLKDGYFHERQSDMQALAAKVQAHLLGKSRRPGAIPSGMIVVAKELTPVDTIELAKVQPIALVTELGGKTGHVAIVARSLNIPCLVGVDHLLEYVRQSEEIVVDGDRGVVIINPDEETRRQCEQRMTEQREQGTLLLKRAREKTLTVDGYSLHIAANVEWLDDIQTVKACGAEGIGLFRTEYLFLGRDTLPDEETQYQHYKKVLKCFPANPVTVRTLDIGGDKRLDPSYIPEVNPALGVRGIRYCFKEKKIFYTQLRALLRASVHGNLRLLFSMVNSLEEVRKIKQILQRVRKELDERGEKYEDNIPLGIMVETPAAALTMDILSKEVDFFSVGTNDLTQYTLAVDRDYDEVSNIYDPLHPGHLRLLKHVVDMSKAEGKPLSICGELAGDPYYLYLLLGMGLKELSMNAVSIPRVKRLLGDMSYTAAQNFVDRLLELKTARDINRAIEQELSRLFPSTFRLETHSFQVI